MVRGIFKLLIIASLWLTLNVSPVPGQVPDGTVKITSRTVAAGVGLSWGDGVLT